MDNEIPAWRLEKKFKWIKSFNNEYEPPENSKFY